MALQTRMTCKCARILKGIGWGVLAFVIVMHVRMFVPLVLHPFGGHEYHHVFAYSGGRMDVALCVLAEADRGALGRCLGRRWGQDAPQRAGVRGRSILDRPVEAIARSR